MWSEHLDCKCVYRMCGRNVLQIGMYLSVELWGEAIFFISMDSYIVYLFVCCFVIDFCGVAATNFYIFCTFFCSSFSSWRRTVHAAILKKTCPTFRCQDSKACHRRFNAKSNVHSMNNIQAPETFMISVRTESVLALSDRAAAWIAEKDWPRLRLISSKKAVFFTDLRAVPFSMQ